MLKKIAFTNSLKLSINLFLNNRRKLPYSIQKVQNTQSHFKYRSNLLKKVLKLRDKDTSNTIIDSNVNELCAYYKSLLKGQKQNFLLELACEHAVHQKTVCKIAKKLISNNCNESQSIRIQDKLKTALSPQYKWLFIHVGRQEDGVKFLVDMRTDLLELLKNTDISDPGVTYLKQLDNTLRELFLLWFSVGFLKLERITWKSSCEMLQKISDYEAVHPVRSWTDLRTRMGSDRRCFVYTHSSMPDEPLVILHTALREEIASSTSGILTPTSSTSPDSIPQVYAKDSEHIKAAIFYSISATQIGLQGIELGNYIIKRVATQLAKEFPTLDKFSSLSPIPKFKTWLFDRLKCAAKDSEFSKDIFSESELEALSKILKTKDVYRELMKCLNGNGWLQIQELVTTLEPILMRMCIRYLYLEKKRGYALDSVANFHLRNGAEMWRINWLADLSARGLSTSCGMMVNYRYYLQEAERNCQTYIENKEIMISSLVEELLEQHNLI